MKELLPAQQRALRASAHHLDPTVSIAGNGLSETVLKEIDRSLCAHELIKIRVYGDDRAFRTELMREICAKLDCAPVQMIGKLLIVYREKPEPEEKPVAARKPRALPREKPESGRTSRTTTGTSAVRRLGASAARPSSGGIARPRRSRRPPKR